jgi:cyclase
MQKISSRIYVENGFRSCNTSFVVTKEGVVLIDTPMVPSEGKKWAQIIAGYGQMRYVIDTEPHYDHAFGNCWFGGTVVGQEGARQSLMTADLNELMRILKEGAPESLPLGSDFHVRPPEITFNDKLTLHLGELTFQLMHLPGHTAHQIAVYIPEEKALFTGDNIVQMIPIMFQARPRGWLESIQKMQQLDIVRIIPGHGNVCGKDFLAEMSRRLHFWIDKVQAALDKGWSLKETHEKITAAPDYPPEAKEPRAAEMVRMGIDHLYEVLQKE